MPHLSSLARTTPVAARLYFVGAAFLLFLAGSKLAAQAPALGQGHVGTGEQLQSGAAAISVEAASAAPAAVSPQTFGAAPASLTGLIADPEGALIPGAVVALKCPGERLNHACDRTDITDSAGHFGFPSLAPGTYTITVSAPGFEPLTLAGIAVETGETRDPLTLTLAVPANRADVTVIASRHDLASDEIHGLEGQRVLGLFPDFYTSFAANPVPLDAGQKFSLALHATTDRMAFVTAGLVASGEQIQKTFPEWGTGHLGYAKRYGAAYTDAFTGKLLGAAVFPSLFRQDPRYFYMGTGTVKLRARHAILSAFLARSDSGRWEPNYSHILGNAAAGALSTTYHPASDSAGKLALSNALLGTLGEAGVNLTREFLLKPFIHGIPTTP